jgi:protein subunit release factor B
VGRRSAEPYVRDLPGVIRRDTHGSVKPRPTHLTRSPTNSSLPARGVGRYAGPVSTFPVSTDKTDELTRRMMALGIRESDLEESFVRSGGNGGQNVNKVATCVQLVHVPTGLQVKCQTTRQQGMNRFLARQLLLEKLEARNRQRIAEAQAAAEKVRRQKRGRSRGAKLRILADKSHNAAKKRSRRGDAE